MQSFKIVAYLLLGCTDSGGYVKYTPKYIIVGGERGGLRIFFKVPIRQSFKIVAYLLLGYFWLVGGGGGEGEGFVDNKGFLSHSGGLRLRLTNTN
jgi:hypothetical protein